MLYFIESYCIILYGILQSTEKSRLLDCESEEGFLKFMPVLRKAQQFLKKSILRKTLMHAMKVICM